MKAEQYYPLGSERSHESPLHIDVSGLNLPGLTIKARTFREKGSEIYVYYNDKKIDRHIYTRQRYPVYHIEMACDIYSNISVLFEDKTDACFAVKNLQEITPLIIAKCEFHQGVNLKNYNYEVLVTFY